MANKPVKMRLEGDSVLEPFYVTWKDKDGNGQALAFSEMLKGIEEYAPRAHKSSNSSIFKNVYSPSMSIRDEFGRMDYDYYRQGERVPTEPKAKIQACDDAYHESGNGIVRNIVDLMGDFVVQGIDVVHPVKKVDRFFKKWFHETVSGLERSERFANMIPRLGNVIIKVTTGKITLKQSREYYKTASSPDIVISPKEYEPEKREIPIGYTFLHPCTLDVASPELSTFVDPTNPTFTMTVPSEVVRAIKFPKDGIEESLITKMPTDMVNRIRNGDNKLILPPEKVRSFYYKKDDWSTWASPMIYSILSDLNSLKKMKLADLSALDGVISQIRIWKLGNLEAKMFPSAAAIQKLADMLVNGVSGGVIDIIWGPDLEYKDVTTSLHNFLGESKYVPWLNAIYTGLGIPPLFSGATNQGSFTNNFLAIKTLIERLQYIRNMLVRFWKKELKLVQQAMGFKKPARIKFTRMTLNDESAILGLLKDLADRNILSDEFVQEMVGAIPEIEQFRLKQENKQRGKGSRSLKAGPFHNPNVKEEIVKNFVALGEITPGQAGINLKEKLPGEKTPNENRTAQAVKLAKSKPDKESTGIVPSKKPPGDKGRPQASKDKKKRKDKIVKPRRTVNSFIQTMAWAEHAQSQIAGILEPVFLEQLNKKNLRQLNEVEFNTYEETKFNVLCKLKPFVNVDETSIGTAINDEKPLDELIKTMFIKVLESYEQKNQKAPTVATKRSLQSSIYAAFFSDKVGDENTSDSNDGLSSLPRVTE